MLFEKIKLQNKKKKLTKVVEEGGRVIVFRGN